jgi:beta-lactamase class A
MRYYFLILFACLCCTLAAQPKTDTLLQNILLKNKNPLLQNVVQQKDTFRLQIIYTQINRDKNNIPSFKNYYFNEDSNLFFNPASTVKLPLALLSLEKLNEMNIKGVNKYTAMQFDSVHPWQVPAYKDSSSQSGLPSIANYIKKAFLISDNDAYNRMYQFNGQQRINRNLHAKGYTSLRITRQFMGLNENQNRYTNPIRFVKDNGSLVYKQPEAYNTDSFYYDKIIKIGKAHLDSKDSLINEPIDFTKANNVPLKDLQQILQSVLFPASVPVSQRFNLTKNDYNFLYQYLSQYPSETNYPKYDTAKYYDSYVKFYFKNGGNKIPPYIRVFNKVGWAYGFLIDVSYIVDFKNHVEFMLTSTIYVNSDGVLNDDKYDYETIGWPFMYELGQTIYQYELQRPRKYTPDLKRFQLKYDQRDVNDKRPSIKDADN